MSVTHDNYQTVWDCSNASLHGHLRSSSEGMKAPPLPAVNGAKIFTSCAAVVVASLATGQPLISTNNARISTSSIVSSTEVIRSTRTTTLRDKIESGSYVDIVSTTREPLLQMSVEVFAAEGQKEVTMLNVAELNRRERILKSTINGTAVAMAVGFLTCLLGGVSFLELTPGLLAGIGVLGSCGIQLNKVDALRKK